MRATLVLVILLLVIFVGCITGPVCNKPYILVGNNCCLDVNENKICDTDETTTTSTISSTTTTITTTTIEPTTTTTLFSYEKDEVISSWAKTIPEIDGKISEDEWTDASILVLPSNQRLYIKNTQNRLFLLWEKSGERKDSERPRLYFDPNSDGKPDYYKDKYSVFQLFFEYQVGAQLEGPSPRGAYPTACTISAQNAKLPGGGDPCGLNTSTRAGYNVFYLGGDEVTISELAIPLPIGRSKEDSGGINKGDVAYFSLLFDLAGSKCYPGPNCGYSDNTQYAKLIFAGPLNE